MQDRDLLRHTFDQRAELYHRARPDYPELMFDALFELADFKSGARVLEVGCGTGQATRPLARRGAQVVCVELGGQLAAVARRELAQFRDVEVFTAPFESFEPRVAGFDVVLAATSWRWVDPALRYRKAARMLRRGGTLAIIDGGQHVFPPGFDPFFKQIQRYYDSIGEGADHWFAPDEVPDLHSEIEASRLFGEVKIRRYVWTVDYSTEEYIDLLNTYSNHIAMTPAKRERIFAGVRELMANRADRPIHKHYLSILHIAKLMNDA
jgi:SAM-dependent methyltransferase